LHGCKLTVAMRSFAWEGELRSSEELEGWHIYRRLERKLKASISARFRAAV